MVKDKIDGIRHFVEQLSQKPELQSYINNLDDVLGIKAINSCRLEFGVNLCKRHEQTACHNCNINCDNVKELTLTNNELAINDKDFDWFIVAKKDNREYFRIIGVNKKDETKGVVYELGETKDINNIEIILKKDEDGWRLLLLNYSLENKSK